MTVTLHVHRDIFPHTDHGYTWVEYARFETDNGPISPWIPAAACCERLGNLPGGPIPTNMVNEEREYAPDGVSRIIKTDETHHGFYRVGRVFITRAE